MYVLAFDRDETLDVNPHPEREAVPLEWVRYLAAETEHEVWAIGNQTLTEEAGIPGVRTAVNRLTEAGTLAEVADPEAVERWLSKEHRLTDWPSRADRIDLVAHVCPDADRYIVVDDMILSYVDGWTHYYPWDFVDAVRSGELDVGLPADL